jgi:nucleoside-diphosphate-sugar epimerase
MNILIGQTSQLSHYFPQDYIRLSSRNINFDFIQKNNVDTVHLLFAEQRTFLDQNEKFFTDINVDYTLSVINKIKFFAKKIIVYSTAELWNNYEGPVYLNNDYEYNYTPYIKSKEILCNTINENRKNFNNVKIIYPFNFNSPYRKNGFLFSKIFDSLVKLNKNEIGNINFVRDIIHPSIIVKESIIANEDKLIGSGELINLQKYISDIFSIHNLNYEDYLVIKNENSLNNTRKDYFSGIKFSSYEELLTLTKKDIYEYKTS